MAKQTVKISKSLVNWALLVGGVLVLLYFAGTMTDKKSTMEPVLEYSETVSPDDVPSLEEELNDLSDDSTSDDLKEVEKALQ